MPLNSPACGRCGKKNVDTMVERTTKSGVYVRWVCRGCGYNKVKYYSVRGKKIIPKTSFQKELR